MIAPGDGPALHVHAREDTEPARILVLFTPSGMEAFDPSAFRSIGASVGMDVIGPPLRDVGDARG